MSSRTCPDWPRLTEIAPDLQFKHYTVAEARLPAEALVDLDNFPLDAVAICCDLDKNVFYAGHTDPRVAEALRDPLVRGPRVDDERPWRRCPVVG